MLLLLRIADFNWNKGDDTVGEEDEEEWLLLLGNKLKVIDDDDDGNTKQRKDDDEEEKKGEYLKYTLCIPRRGQDEAEKKKEIEEEKGTIRDNHELTGLHEGDKKEVLENIIEKKEEEKKNDAEEDIKEKALDLSDDDVGEW